MEEKKKITSSDKLPGCERLTRPEEISALSKYLGAIRKTQEAWIEENMPDKPLETEVKDENKVASLPDSVISLEDNKEVKIPKAVDKIDVPEDRIIQDISKLRVSEKVSAIPEELVKLGGGEKEVTLPKEKEELRNNNQPESLPSGVIAVEGEDKKVKIPKDRVGIGDVIDEIQSLPDSMISLDDSRKIELPGTKIGLDSGDDPSLPNLREGVPGNIEDPELPNLKEGRPGEDPDINLPADRLKINPAETDKLPTDKLKRPGEEEDTKLPKTKISPTRPITNVSKLPDLLLSPETSVKDIDDYVKTRKNDELYTDIIEALTIGGNGEIGNGNIKLAGLLNALLGKDDMTSDQIKGAAQSLFNYFQSEKVLINAAIIEPELPDNSKLPPRARYILPERSGFGYADYASPDTYIRFLAETATYGMSGQGWFGKDNHGISGWGRRTLLDTTLKALVATRRWTEKKLGINKDRLPYDQGNITGKKDIIRKTIEKVDESGKYHPDIGTLPGEKGNGLFEVGGRWVGRIGEGVDMLKNAETGRNLIADGLGTLARSIRDAQRQSSDSAIEISNSPNSEKPAGVIHNKPSLTDFSMSVDVSKAEDAKNYFETLAKQVPLLDHNRVDESGLALTLQDLCNTRLSSIATVDKLKDTLAASPYTTTPGKYIKALGAKNNMTLDTNAYWEVVIEPFCHKRLTGGWSFLPSIHEINMENKLLHGWNTHYDKWIPLSNVELQKSKLTSKTLGLYDGEISYPISVEYTNELRMTVIDDQYKSWRRYFQRCSDVSVYSSEAHDISWYIERNKDDNHLAIPTAIDKTKFCIAYYKNVTFRIRLYFMTPQFSTIKKFDLLGVLKDFSEEYYGDIDAGSQDLNISFSIVGENPEDDNVRYEIDSDGVGSWAYGGSQDLQHLGGGFGKSIQASENIRKAAEDNAAQGNQRNNDKDRKQGSEGTNKDDHPKPVINPSSRVVPFVSDITGLETGRGSLQIGKNIA